MRPDRSVFYVKWVQQFVDFKPEKRLRERSREDIEAFLAQLANRPGIKDWQVRQAEHAPKSSLKKGAARWNPDTVICESHAVHVG